MPCYDWRDHRESSTFTRFPDWAQGAELWRDANASPSSLARLQFTLAQARLQPPLAHRPLPHPRVFVSHRAIDVDKAERLAWLADQAGFEFWLDVLDPQLHAINALAGRGNAAPATHALLVACVIEMALLNSTHVLVAMTNHTAGSLWVPYELGRVKIPTVVSTQASAWISASLSSVPEYLWLVVKNITESDVNAWFQSEYYSWCGVATPGPAGNWRGNVPAPL